MKKSKKLLIIAVSLFIFQFVILTGASTFQIYQDTGKMDYLAGFLNALLNFFQYFALVIPSLLCLFFYFVPRHKKVYDDDITPKASTTNLQSEKIPPQTSAQVEQHSPKIDDLKAKIEIAPEKTLNAKENSVEINNAAPAPSIAHNPEDEAFSEQYQNALIFMNSKSSNDIESAAEIFTKLKDYKDSIACLAFCTRRTTDLKGNPKKKR